MSIIQRAFRNIFWLGLSEAGTRILVFLGTVYLGRVLGKTGFGLFSLSMAVGIYFWVLVDLGITGYGTREVAKDKNLAAELYSILNSLRFILSIGLFILFILFLYITTVPTEKKLILIAGAFYAIANSLSSDWVFRGLENMKYILSARLASSVSFLVFIYFTVKSSTDTFYASIEYSSSFIIGSLVFMYLIKQKLGIPFKLNLYFNKWFIHIKESAFFAINGIFNSITIFIPILFMDIWSTPEELGIFSASHRVIVMLINMLGLLIWGIFPTLSNLYVTDYNKFKDTYDTFLRLLITLLVPICICAAMNSSQIISVLFGESYQDGVSILSYLSIFILLSILRYNFGNALICAGFHRMNMRCTGYGALIVAGACILLIPWYHGLGAAWALIAGEAVILSLMVRLYFRNIKRLDYFNMYIFKVIIISVLMILLIYGLPLQRTVSSIIGILAYFMLAFMFGIIDLKTFNYIYKVIGRSNVSAV